MNNNRVGLKEILSNFKQKIINQFQGERRRKTIVLLSIILSATLVSILSFVLLDTRVSIRIYNDKLIDNYGSIEGNNADIARWEINPLCIASDEFAASQQPRGLQFWEYINETSRNVFKYARLHNVFTSSEGDRRGAANAGGDVVIDNGDGTYSYDWTILDNLYDNLISCNITPLVELGFMPIALSSQPNDEPERRIPEKWQDWRDLVSNFTQHLIDRYSVEKIRTWRFEVWNEPDAGSFWSDGIDAYCMLYNETVSVIKDINVNIIVGGPGIANDMGEFEDFLEYCSINEIPIDFISFHTKGSDGVQLHPSHEHLVNRIESYFKIMKQFPEFDQNQNPDIEYICTEADPIVGSHKNKYDRPKFAFRDHEYYSAWFSHTLINLVELQIQYNYTLHGLFSHNILFPWETQTFYGTRGFLTPLFLQGTPIPSEIPEDIPLTECNAVVGKPIHTVAQLISRIPFGQSFILRTETTGLSANRGLIKTLAYNCTDGKLRILISHHNEIKTAFRDRYVDISFETAKSGVDVTEYIINRQNNNAFRAWESMGSPDYVTNEQISSLQETASLSTTNSFYVQASDGLIQMSIKIQEYTTILLEIQ
ncbi:MAG: hypothetical protein GF364_16615 [Candidatus Lokiarchaeota archaeon]|nr:hypothetical protein [Candidatus Lokiarchaeota archaeon]